MADAGLKGDAMSSVRQALNAAWQHKRARLQEVTYSKVRTSRLSPRSAAGALQGSGRIVAIPDLKKSVEE
jgi:hypothetical protein